ncbi:endonuclease III [Leptospira sp. GIMC2001]|uniref:endonuclease III n=1 Tax=Leptospira sp. GIMC2001 TaxID=1513297 RepID=UPI003FA57ABA
MEPWEQISNYPSHIKKIYEFLSKEFGSVSTPLTYSKDYELAIAVILSAQCTDERVNQVTPALFEAFPTLQSFASAKPKDIEPYVFSTGFYRNKAKSIQGFAQMLIEKFNSNLPRTMEEMLELPGFGRKTANVVLGEVHDIIEGFVVDTHVKRIAYKLGLTKYKDPIRIEREILEKVPKKYWNHLSLYLIFHGRKTCIARRPLCDGCGLRKICPSAAGKVE